MRLFVLGPDLNEPQPVWMSIFWPHYQALSQSVPTTFLPFPPDDEGKGRLRRKLDVMTSLRARAGDLARRVGEALDPDGPNILLVYALNGGHAHHATLLDDVWDRFDARVLNVVDTFQPGDVARGSLSRFDLILSFCTDLASEFERETKVPSLYFPPHSDVLTYHSLRDWRPLDLMLVGRRDADRHAPLHRHFNAPDQDRIFLDFVTRTQAQPLAEEEFSLLMTTYSRAKAAFCYEPSEFGRFRRRSPLTGRWIHAWAAGCTVLGTAPTSEDAAAEMDWPDATIELPDDPDASVDLVEAILSDEDGLLRRRHRNIQEALRRHDTRVRLRTLLGTLDMPIPDTLAAELQRLDQMQRHITSLR